MLWPAQLRWRKEAAARRTYALCVMVFVNGIRCLGIKNALSTSLRVPKALLSIRLLAIDNP